MTELKSAALAQFESGHASAQDSLQAEAELTHMEHDAVSLGVRPGDRGCRDERASASFPAAPLPPPVTELPLDVDLDEDGVAKSTSEAVAKDLDIQLARSHARAEEARVERAERKNRTPTSRLSTSYNSMWAAPEHRWTVGLGFNLPIEWGRRRGAIDEAKAGRGRYQSEIARLSDRARTQVAVALARLREALHVEHLYEQRLFRSLANKWTLRVPASLPHATTSSRPLARNQLSECGAWPANGASGYRSPPCGARSGAWPSACRR